MPEDIPICTQEHLQCTLFAMKIIVVNIINYKDNYIIIMPRYTNFHAGV